MKIVYLFFLGMILGLSSCMWGDTKKPKPAITTDTLTYSYHIIKQKAADCGTKPDNGCTVVKIKYPFFFKDGLLNDTLKHKLLNLFALNDKDTSLNQLTSNFIKTYDQNKSQDDRKLFYTLDMNASIVRQDSSLTTLVISGYSFEGGAHGGSETVFINWNTKASKNISLNDIFINGFTAKLNAIAEEIFRKQEKLSPTASLANDYFFKDDKFALNQNFSVTPLGLRFIYNQYEIKPYAAGQTELLIPYAKIKSLLRPNTVVSQYIK
ncbi:DUF3298 and DUF4163 domain-containing protein [Mucilaginibacter sp.]|uniref:DUF3298 and DUF4163 domain-containing protein n=1 Tax=Mucilaginibacter sp. TaxID=1882438 RepID=UPI0026117A51|nr:DUF3298 and DUF4163 domain-containing protein [Mucilaginibacter sp.]MDB5031410.1 hypothetical protein [Mucilaginibacter sp.]